MPYTYTLTGASPISRVGDLVCGTVNTHTCNAADACCQADLYRISLLINEQCRGSIEYATYGGTTRMPTYAKYGPGHLVFKLTGLEGVTPANANGLQVCFQLRSPCSTLSALCPNGMCQATLMNKANGCCPLSQLRL